METHTLSLMILTFYNDLESVLTFYNNIASKFYFGGGYKIWLVATMGTEWQTIRYNPLSVRESNEIHVFVEKVYLLTSN